MADDFCTACNGSGLDATGDTSSDCPVCAYPDTPSHTKPTPADGEVRIVDSTSPTGERWSKPTTHHGDFGGPESWCKACGASQGWCSCAVEPEPTCKAYGAGHRCTLPEGHGGNHYFDTPLCGTDDPVVAMTCDTTTNPDVQEVIDAHLDGMTIVGSGPTDLDDGTWETPCLSGGAECLMCENCAASLVRAERARIERDVKAILAAGLIDPMDVWVRVDGTLILAAIRGGDDA